MSGYYCFGVGNTRDPRHFSGSSIDKAGNKTKPSRMQMVLDALEDDEYLEYIKNWRKLVRTDEIIEEPEQLYGT